MVSELWLHTRATTGPSGFGFCSRMQGRALLSNLVIGGVDRKLSSQVARVMALGAISFQHEEFIQIRIFKKIRACMLEKSSYRTYLLDMYRHVHIHIFIYRYIYASTYRETKP